MLPWHLDAIERMDDARMRHYFAKRSEPEPDKEQESIASRPLTSRLFDALFPSKRK